jgi:hypothetical protein
MSNEESTEEDAFPMDIRLNETVNIDSQNTGDYLYYSPSEIRNAYNATSLLNSGYNGSGVTISIVDAYGDPYIQGELNNFSATFGIPPTTVRVACVDGPCNYAEGISTGWNREIALDVEWAHAMAPGATINLYIGSNGGQPLYDAVAAAVAGTNGNGTYLSPSSIISMSWGTPENDIGESGAVAQVFGENYPWLNQVFQLGAAEGITFFASSGDWGAYDQALGQTSPYGGAPYPSTDPFVTGVGGTSLYMGTDSESLQSPGNATGSYGYETAWSWNNHYEWGTGGGFSTFFGRPSWQSGLGVPSGKTRGTPDVSWDADPLTGVLVYTQGAFGIYGGTSVGSPSWAGSMALIDQVAGHDLGFIDPLLYAILKDPVEYGKAFHDITVGDNDPFQADPGWNPLTGVGTPNIGELARYLSQPPTSLSVFASSSVAPGTSASYSTVQIYASALNQTSPVTEGAVHAEIISSTGGLVGDVSMTYDSSIGLWAAAYRVKPGDPAGMWSVTVQVTSGSQSGTGATTFSVGDGVTLLEQSKLFSVGDEIPVAAIVTGTAGSVVESGSFSATFRLGTPTGPVEGTVALAYNSTAGMWEGVFPISKSVDQGAWVLEVSGADSSGNLAATAYSWLNVGMIASVYTDSTAYSLGEGISIYSAISYNGRSTATGAYTATIGLDGRSLGTVPLSYNAEQSLWMGAFNVPLSDSAGFYRIVVTGNDGSENSAYGETLVSVATPSATSISCAGSVAVLTSSACIATVSGNDTAGIVSFTSSGLGTFTSGVCTLVGGSCSVGYVPVSTAGSPQTIDASYSGDIVSLPSEGTSVVWVNPITSFSTVACSPSTVLVNASATCTVTVADGHPTGNVSWAQVKSPGSVTISPSSCTLSSSYQCQVAIEGASPGSVTLSAKYNGDASDTPSRGTFAVIVEPVVSVAVVCAPASVVVGMSATCTASVVGSPSNKGKVTWLSSGAELSELMCTLKNGACSVKYTPMHTGSVNITASLGNNPSPPGNFDLTVTLRPSTTKVSCTPTSVAVGSSKKIKCTAVVAGYSPTGTVTWSTLATGVGSVAFTSGVNACVLNKGHCSVTLNGTAAGAVAIKGNFSGDSNNVGSFEVFTLTIKPARTNLSLSCVSTSGDTWTCTATLNGYFGSVANENITWSKVSGSGDVTFPNPANCALSSGGTCTITLKGTTLGTIKIEAAYSGDVNNAISSKTAKLRIT